MFPIIVLVYYRLAKREEQSMMARFGEEYRTYRSRVPMFFPRRRESRRLIAATRATTAA